MMSYEYLMRRAIFNEDGIVISLGGPYDNGTDEPSPTRIYGHDFAPIIEAFPEYTDWKQDMETWEIVDGLYEGMRLGYIQYQHDNGISVERQDTLEAQVERIGNPYY
jgi:hypothetical protein